MHDYTLIRSSRKTLALEIKRDLSILVRAPKKASKFEIDHFVEKHDLWITKHLIKQASRLSSHPEPTKEELLSLKSKAKKILPSKVLYYSSLLSLFPVGVKVTNAKTRFGSCSAKNSLCFSARLFSYPEEALDYVIVHELCHIAHKNHGKEFYKLIFSVMPDFKERQALLKG